MTSGSLGGVRTPARLAVTVTPDAARHLRAGHPWVYDGSITSVRVTGMATAGVEPLAGDLGVVFDRHRRFLAVGLWDPTSPIRLRVLQHGVGATIDAIFWHARIGAALDRRRSLVDSTETTGYRCVHGEDDDLPGLVIDKYGDIVVVKLYTSAWLPHLDAVLDALAAHVGETTVVVRLARTVQRTADLRDGTVVRGSLTVHGAPFLEAGLAFEADVINGQKTGWFLDQRDNRIAVAAKAADARVLDVFSAGGGFTVHAAAAGARSVTSIDASAGAMAAVGANLARNQHRTAVARCTHEAIVADAYEALADLARSGRRFDVVVVDPPSFAAKQHQVTTALAAYRRLTDLAVRLVANGGTYVQASCSRRVPADAFVEAVLGAARRAGVAFVGVERTLQPVDHPMRFAEGSYLKAVFGHVAADRIAALGSQVRLAPTTLGG